MTLRCGVYFGIIVLKEKEKPRKCAFFERRSHKIVRLRVGSKKEDAPFCGASCSMRGCNQCESDRQTAERVEQIAVYWFVLLDSLLERHVNGAL